VTMLTDSCPTCDGSGYVKSRYTVCYEVLRRLKTAAGKGDGRQFNVYLAPEVARLLVEEEKASLEYLENMFGTKINIIARPMPVMESFDIKAV